MPTTSHSGQAAQRSLAQLTLVTAYFSASEANVSLTRPRSDISWARGTCGRQALRVTSPGSICSQQMCS
jgi:hypothetical protein